MALLQGGQGPFLALQFLPGGDDRAQGIRREGRVACRRGSDTSLRNRCGNSIRHPSIWNRQMEGEWRVTVIAPILTNHWTKKTAYRKRVSNTCLLQCAPVSVRMDMALRAYVCVEPYQSPVEHCRHSIESEILSGSLEAQITLQKLDLLRNIKMCAVIWGPSFHWNQGPLSGR